MRLSMSINGATPIIASVAGSGFLNAHLNMRSRAKEGDYGRDVRIVGIER